MKVLYEVLVPTIYGDTLKPIRTAHHKEWDKYIQTITGGLTILSSAKGKWIYKGVEYPEKIIPVRVMVEETQTIEKTQINKIINFTLRHYRQNAVMYYVISREVEIVYSQELVGA
jgi:hypothetical protein